MVALYIFLVPPRWSSPSESSLAAITRPLELTLPDAVMFPAVLSPDLKFAPGKDALESESNPLFVYSLNIPISD